MNIFFLDKNPTVAAQMLADIHCGSANYGGKMILESSQMLINCYSEAERTIAPKTQNGTIRKLSYMHHPCSQWVLKSIANFNWLLEHALAMIEEKQYRGGKSHFCSTVLNWMKENPPTMNFSFTLLTDPALAMPDHCKLDDPVLSYRLYYIMEKKDIVSWTKRQTPVWWT